MGQSIVALDVVIGEYFHHSKDDEVTCDELLVSLENLWFLRQI